MTSKYEFEFDNDFISLRLVHFTEYTTRDNSHQFYKVFLEDKENKKTYSVKVNKTILAKLINQCLEK